MKENCQYKSIAPQAFYTSTTSTTLKGVILPDTVTYIGDWAFRNQSGLELINFNDNIYYIGEYSFYQSIASDRHLVVPKLPAKLTFLGQHAFQYAGDKVTFSDIPVGLTEIPKRAFYRCPNVSVTTFGSLTGEVGGSKLTTIGESAFQNNAANTAVTEIWILDSVTNIAKQAFTGYGKDDSIPVNVTYSESECEWADIDIGKNVNFNQTYTGS